MPWELCAQDADTALRMMRTSHRGLFRQQGGRGAVVDQVFALNGWKGFVKGDSEVSQEPYGRINARLQKCARTGPPHCLPLLNSCTLCFMLSRACCPVADLLPQRNWPVPISMAACKECKPLKLRMQGLWC